MYFRQLTINSVNSPSFTLALFLFFPNSHLFEYHPSPPAHCYFHMEHLLNKQIYQLYTYFKQFQSLSLLNLSLYFQLSFYTLRKSKILIHGLSFNSFCEFQINANCKINLSFNLFKSSYIFR